MTLTCFLLVLILAAQGYAVYRWRQRKFPRPGWIFNLWAPALYAVGLLATWLIGWALTYVLVGADPSALEVRSLLLGLAVVTGLALIAIVGLTLFFRWILNTDMTDVSK